MLYGYPLPFSGGKQGLVDSWLPAFGRNKPSEKGSCTRNQTSVGSGYVDFA